MFHQLGLNIEYRCCVRLTKRPLWLSALHYPFRFLLNHHDNFRSLVRPIDTTCQNQGGGRCGRSVTHLDGHPFLESALHIFPRCSLNNFAVFFPEVILQRLNLLTERIEGGRKPISMGLCLIFEFVQLRKKNPSIVSDITRREWDVGVQFCSPVLPGQWKRQR